MISFVILHYISEEDTKKCVESIKRVDELDKVNIVIVDNGSPNGSGQRIFDEYKEDSKVDVILSKDNLGFSKGNNIGCEYAIEKYHPDFLFVVNNDILIKDKDVVKRVYQCYEKTSFDAMGPKIWNLVKGYNHNPFGVMYKLEDIENAKRENEVKMKLLNSAFPISYYIYSRFFCKKRDEAETLHGAALVFSKKYYEKFGKVFPELTFMYGEESFLEYRRRKYNLKYVFEYEIVVDHNHSATTRKLNKNLVSKWKFQQEKMNHYVFELERLYKFDMDI